MKVNQFNSDNINRLVKIQKYLNENYDINVGKILPQKKLDTAYKNVEQRIANLRNKGSKFQQDPNYGMNIMVRDALGIMINEGMYYEGENYRKLMDELYEYGCSLAESGDDYETVMASCGKKYEVMPARFPKEMVMAALGDQMTPMFENPALLSIARAGAAGVGFGAAGGQVNASMSGGMATVVNADADPKIEMSPTDKLHQGLAKILKKDSDQYGVGELFAELEGIDVKKADALYDVYSNACKAHNEEPMNFKENKEEGNFDSFLDEIVEDMVTEEIAGTSVEEAEVVTVSYTHLTLPRIERCRSRWSPYH